MANVLLEGPIVSSEVEEQCNTSLGEKYFFTLDDIGDEIIQIDALTGITETATSLKRRAIQLAMELKRINVKEGDIILVSCKPKLEEAIVMLGIFFVGAVVFTIHPDQDYEEFCQVVRTVKPTVAFCDQRVAVNLERATHEKDVRMYIFNSDSRKPLNKIYDKAVDPAFLPVRIENPKTTTAILVLTDGIKDYPKIVRISHYASLVRCKSLGILLKGVKKVVAYVPLMGSVQILLCCASFESNFLRIIPRTFTERDACRTVRDMNIDFMILGTEKAVKLAEFYTDYLDFNIDCLKTILIGGIAASINVLHYVYESFSKLQILHAYFCLEVGILTATEANFKPLERPGSCGTLLPGITMKIVDFKTSEPVVPYAWGEILVKSDGLSMGYINQISDNMSEGFFKTGDVAEYDEHGYIYIHGRLEDIFMSKGNVFSAMELHAIAYKQENIYDVVACSHHNQLFLYCVLDNRKITTKDIFDFLVNKVEPHMMPNKIFILNEFPRSVNGKIKKYLLERLLLRKSLVLIS